ncbi:hypothetical protein SEA_BILLNYE_186 [Streptomyces phage BillNye]|uniref:Uncharacterized protein n=2 Tax=Wilnyevirus billnye TaxID=2560486 RepID=A0A2L1IW07_9CAUD|nr:hypothetical protein FDJ30_gp075 [Streptomyces phage BillNye]AVD99358.1 hypothetical protein SEA_BILLNYE_186 [Streptomyces phage BillNye]QBZ72441.1 hypothetical protein SEA_CIRCINUS_187 [Streptomyces phage Circinus]
MNLWQELSRSLKGIFMKKCDMSDGSAEICLRSLRKAATLDVILEFNDQLEPPSTNRHYNAGYYDALADLARYARTKGN